MSAAAGRVVAAREACFAYEGRVAVMGDDVKMGFPGVVIRFNYSGPAPTVRVQASTAHCHFNLSINGWDPVALYLNRGANTIELPSGSAPETGWAVELTRRTESWQGVATFQGVYVPDGCRLLAPPPAAVRRLLVIGDSISCGEYIDLMPPLGAVEPTPRTANAGRSYGRLLGREFGAQTHLVAYGGRGVVRDWEGKTDTGTAPEFFERALPDDPSSVWDHAAYQPDAVVVCLGQNDFHPGVPEEAGYTRAYGAFVERIRAVHPRAAIVLAGSPMQGSAAGSEDRVKREALLRMLRAVVARRHEAGDPRIVAVEVRHQAGTAANGHPSAFQHEQMAADLAGPLRALTGW